MLLLTRCVCVCVCLRVCVCVSVSVCDGGGLLRNGGVLSHTNQHALYIFISIYIFT